MNSKCKKEMHEILINYCDWNSKQKLADFGSYDVNGTYRKIIPEKWTYTGYDIVSGPNVDVVMNEFKCKARSNFYDVVISGATLEHCTNPELLVKEMARVLKPSGIMVIQAPSVMVEHGSNVLDIQFGDYWRILPQGLELLINHANLEIITVYTLIINKKKKFSVGIGKKSDSQKRI
ncbi:MAG: methyltransferase domain-containing protein [Desulfobacterales bacterium]